MMQQVTAHWESIRQADGSTRLEMRWAREQVSPVYRRADQPATHAA